MRSERVGVQVYNLVACTSNNSHLCVLQTTHTSVPVGVLFRRAILHVSKRCCPWGPQMRSCERKRWSMCMQRSHSLVERGWKRREVAYSRGPENAWFLGRWLSYFFSVEEGLKAGPSQYVRVTQTHLAVISFVQWGLSRVCLPRVHGVQEVVCASHVAHLNQLATVFWGQMIDHIQNLAINHSNSQRFRLDLDWAVIKRSPLKAICIICKKY